jgi:hypothetical protein
LKTKYYILLGSLVVSLLLWLSLNLNLTYEVNYRIPVRINVIKPYAVASQVPLYFDVRLKGKGWNFIALYTSVNPEFSYNVDPKYDNYFVVLPKQYLIENLGISSDLAVTNIYPDTLLISIAHYAEKYIKIIPSVNISCKEGYQVIGDVVLEPDSIKVGGAVNIINSLPYIFTKDIFLNNLSSSVYKSIGLSDTLRNILWKSHDDVFMRVRVELSAEKEIRDIDVKVNELPSDKDVILIPSHISLQVRGGVNQLAGLDQENIPASVSFNELQADTTGAVEPKLELPEGVLILSRKPEKIQYIIKKK